jgi:hypothetical protein
VCAVAKRSEANRSVDFDRSLVARRPDLAAQLHPTRNPGIDPSTLGAWSRQRVLLALPRLRARLGDRPR